MPEPVYRNLALLTDAALVGSLRAYRDLLDAHTSIGIKLHADVTERLAEYDRRQRDAQTPAA